MVKIAYHIRRNNPELRLFTLPFAGGGPSLYRTWSNQLSERIEVLPLAYPGREDMFGIKPIDNLNDLMDGILNVIKPYLEKPFAFFGYSMGGVMAFEVALRLKAAGLPLPQKLIACACRPPDEQRKENPVYLLDDDKLTETMRLYGGIPEQILKEREFTGSHFFILEKESELLETLERDLLE